MRTAIVSLLNATSNCHGRGQMALAIALGVACGLLPKFSGLSLGLLALMYVLPIHLLLSVMVAVAVSLLAQPLVPVFDQLGTYSLSHPFWSAFWQRLDTYALVPWLGLHNTVVHGATVVATIIFLPVTLIAYAGAAWLMPRQEEQPIEQTKVANSMTAVAPQPDLADDAAIARIEQILAEYDASEFLHGTSTDEILQRADRIVSAVDDILNDRSSDLWGTSPMPFPPVTEADTSVHGLPLSVSSNSLADWQQVMLPTVPDTTVQAGPPSMSGRLVKSAWLSRVDKRRVSREGEVLRNLLHHLRELKQQDPQEKV
jgi:uncharacterized protein (TIGR03546 family)